MVDTPAIGGLLQTEWHGIPLGTPVSVAMGDLQCSVLAAEPTPGDAGILSSTCTAG